MKKLLILILLICCPMSGINHNIVVETNEKLTSSSTNDKPKESEELMYQDMLMLYLLPHITKKIGEIYQNKLNHPPEVYPYFVNVTDVQRVNGFVKLMHWKHLKDPQKADFPPNWKDVLKKQVDHLSLAYE